MWGVSERGLRRPSPCGGRPAPMRVGWNNEVISWGGSRPVRAPKLRGSRVSAPRQRGSRRQGRCTAYISPLLGTHVLHYKEKLCTAWLSRDAAVSARSVDQLPCDIRATWPLETTELQVAFLHTARRPSRATKKEMQNLAGCAAAQAAQLSGAMPPRAAPSAGLTPMRTPLVRCSGHLSSVRRPYAHSMSQEHPSTEKRRQFRGAACGRVSTSQHLHFPTRTTVLPSSERPLKPADGSEHRASNRPTTR